MCRPPHHSARGTARYCAHVYRPRKAQAQDMGHLHTSQQCEAPCGTAWCCVQVYRPRKAEAQDMERFHTADYIEFLRNVNPDNMVGGQAAGRPRAGARQANELVCSEGRLPCPLASSLGQSVCELAGRLAPGVVAVYNYHQRKLVKHHFC